MTPYKFALVAVATLFAGPVGTVVSVGGLAFWRLRRKRPEPVPMRLVLIVLLLEVRSGRSVLAALHAASQRVTGFPELVRLARVAEISGPEAAVSSAGAHMRPVLAQLVRAHRSGAPVDGTIRRMLDERLAEERAAQLARARSLPVRLMLPVTLLMLPGLVLLLYAPSIIRLFDDLTGGLL